MLLSLMDEIENIKHLLTTNQYKVIVENFQTIYKEINKEKIQQMVVRKILIQTIINIQEIEIVLDANQYNIIFCKTHKLYKELFPKKINLEKRSKNIPFIDLTKNEILFIDLT